MVRRLPTEELRIGSWDDRLEDPTAGRRFLERGIATHRLEAAAGNPRGGRRAR